MPTTLTNGATPLTLPDHLEWVDEFAWGSVQSANAFSVAGALLVDRSVKLAGRPITLSGGVNFAWSTRSVALTLHAWAQQVQPSLTLVYRGVSYPVAFDHSGQPPLQVTPVVDLADPAPQDACYFTMRLITLG